MTQVLGAAITISKGKKHKISESPSNTAKRLIGIDDLRNDNLLRYTDDKKGVEAVSEDVLIAWDGANAGTIGYGKSGFIGSTIARLRIKPESRIHPPFLGLYLKSQFDYFRKTSTGATIPHINRKALEGIPIPKIELNDQIRIAHLLNKVERLIAQRKQHLQQLDDLLKGVFLEMFSSSVEGYDAWPLVEIRDLAEKHRGAMRTGPFGSNLLHSEFNEDGDVAVLGIDNAVQNRFAWSERRYITQEKYKELQNYRIYPGDVIVTIMGTIGRSAVIPDDIPLAINTKHLAAITLNKKIANPIFVSYSIHSSPFILNQFKSKNRGAIMKGLNLGLIKETKLKRPPVELQNKFAAIHKKIDEVKCKYQHSLNELKLLYDALSQKAFKGELDLSQISLPDSQDRTNEVSADSMQAQKSSEQVIDKLNKFNSQHAVFLDALNSMPALKIANSPVFKAARELTEQAALWRTPLDQFRNMGSIAKATAAIATAINIPEVNSTALLARQIAIEVPKTDMAWLKDQQAIINSAVGPFSEMRQAIAALQLPDPEGRLTESESTVSALQAAVSPGVASDLALAIQQDDNENEPRYIFTRDDILQVLSGDQPLSAVNLMSKLAELEVITPEGYSRIQTLLFSLLAEGQIHQQYNDEENAIAFRTCA